MVRRILSLLLCCFIIVGGSAISVCATRIDSYEKPIITPSYEYTNKISVSLSISNKNASISGYIDGLSGVTKIEYTVYLQEKNGSRWSSVDSWSGSSRSTRATYSYSASVTGGKTYRTYTVATVYSGGNSENISAYSAEKKA